MSTFVLYKTASLSMEYVVTASDCDSKWSLGVMTLAAKTFSSDFALKATVNPVTALCKYNNDSLLP